ncbi:MAG: hypothetical protein NVSMB57_05650 [Actinomycetota bacterium]
MRLMGSNGAPFALVRKHLPFTITLSAAALLRIIVMVAYRPALPFYPDAQAYRAIAEHLVPDAVRPIGYPVFLRLLSPFHSLAVVALMQHLMVLGAAIALYALMRHLGVKTVVAVLCVCPVLFDAYQLNVEHSIMSEGLFEALLAASIVLFLWKKVPGVGASAGAGALMAAAALTRTVGLPLVAVLIVYAIVQRIGIVRVAAVIIGAGVLLGGYAAWYKAEQGTFALEGFHGYSLYGRVGPFADCVGMQVPPGEKALCENSPVAKRWGPDFYKWYPQSPARRLPIPDGPAKNALLNDFAMRVIKHQPLTFLRVIGKDLLHYFAPGRWRGDQDALVSSWQFQRSNEDYIAVTAGSYPPPPSQRVTVVRPLAVMLAGYQRFAYTWGPALFLAVLAGAASIFGLRRRLGRGAWEGLLLTASGFILMLFPTFSETFNYRYINPAVMLITPGAALGITVFARRSVARQQRIVNESDVPKRAISSLA